MVKLTVVLDVKETPVCEHGPAVLFERSEVNGPLKKQFFACSATRNGTCTFKSYKCKSTSSNSDNGNDEYAMVGYGACIYARSTGKEGQIKVELIASRSRVAPLKRLSLPRLELCAALLGVKLYSNVSVALRMLAGSGLTRW
ncbi:uncharacterized protein LOC131693898 isoform X2 [Topomyia yanbarensis]|uniref:uncharacterized protein LOC131693898 isoform X2 n=1 Tax=Topomyia yanbarensis TaxID=2498891 RepID=UPI00273C2A7A|nr:uncharacterized protein LOC131693898 isoform X2 [Topomyia yanbarensis]